MATPKKKHLIELMIEAGVKWPDGAEYAAQDKDTLKVNFYEDGKPIPGLSVGAWMISGSCRWIGSRFGIVLPSLCRNWHQTIVTREQYAEAVAATGDGDETIQSQESEDAQSSQPEAQYCASVMRQMPSETIESLLAEIKAKREEHASLVAKAEALALEIAIIEQQVNDKLKEYGFAMYPLSDQSELVGKPWKIGDICIVTHSPDDGSWVGERCVITRIDSADENLPYLVINQSNDEFWVRSIRRP